MKNYAKNISENIAEDVTDADNVITKVKPKSQSQIFNESF